jgi:formylglycine-generating enzyme required for sulfatase activity
MTTEIEQVRQLFQGFRRADAQLHDAEARSREAAVQAEQQARGSLERIGQQRVQTAAIPRQVAEMLAAMRPFLKSHAIEVPSTTQSAPPPAGASALTLIGQCAAAARRAHTELERLQRTLPTLVRVPAGQVRRRVPAWFTVDVEVQELPEFWIGETPVTNRQYAAFLEAQGGMIPAPGNWSAGRYAAGADERPVTDVSHEHAVAYCRWAGLQLPSAAQWLRAARGDSLAAVPWANADPGALVQDGSRDVGAVPANRSQYGARDMLGLTAQWLLASPDGAPQLHTGNGATLDSVEAGWSGAGIRVVRGSGAQLPSAAQRSRDGIRWRNVGIFLAIVAAIGWGGWPYVNDALQRVQESIAAAEQAARMAVAAATSVSVTATASAIAAEQAATATALSATCAVNAEWAPADVFESGQLSWVTVSAGNGQSAFCVTLTEVTNAQYAECVAIGACTVPSTSGERCHYADGSYAEHPVVCVTRAQARAYAAWVGGALPTEAQWLRACQGDDGRTYPWGEAAPDATLANLSRYVNATTQVGSYPAGASPYGALDMSGNVWEWVEPNDGDDMRYVVQGGGFINDGACSAMLGQVGTRGSYDIGFRVVSPGP